MLLRCSIMSPLAELNRHSPQGPIAVPLLPYPRSRTAWRDVRIIFPEDAGNKNNVKS